MFQTEFLSGSAPCGNRNEISINDPFHGGHITKTYGNKPVPWIQVEMNRDLYLTEPWFDQAHV